MSDIERLSTVLWERTDRIFLELGRLDRAGDEHILSGTILYRGRGGPTSFEYEIGVDPSWVTRRLDVRIDEPTGQQQVAWRSDEDGNWTQDGVPLDLPFGCQDVDLAVSPSTNTLAIRRLGLGVGEQATARVLWIQVPSFQARAAEQTYERLDKKTYRFKGKYGSYKIEVDDNGVVLDYPGGGWRASANRVSRRG